ncbi:MAG: DUF4326 domain-containing protein [Candidatus Babeliales bacterium]|jgi:hypothetical protein
MVEVVNIRSCSPRWGQPGDVKIDRTTSWGNPFFMHNESERDAVCDAYALYIMRMLKDGHLDISELFTAKRLGCWCKPKRCHGDFLKKLIEDDKYDNS